jgi:hypothetical protein
VDVFTRLQECNKDSILIIGGAGSGKSYGAMKYAVAEASTGKRIVFYRNTREQLKRITIPLFHKIEAELGTSCNKKNIIFHAFEDGISSLLGNRFDMSIFDYCQFADVPLFSRRANRRIVIAHPSWEETIPTDLAHYKVIYTTIQYDLKVNQ